MCAIAGLLARSSDYLKHIRRMTDLMAHRGPDDEGSMFAGPKGVWASQAVVGSASGLSGGTFPDSLPADAFLALGHRRLSILDLTQSGHQPMSYQDRYWIAYNGE